MNQTLVHADHQMIPSESDQDSIYGNNLRAQISRIADAGLDKSGSRTYSEKDDLFGSQKITRKKTGRDTVRNQWQI